MLYSTKHLNNMPCRLSTWRTFYFSYLIIPGFGVKVAITPKIFYVIGDEVSWKLLEILILQLLCLLVKKSDSIVKKVRAYIWQSQSHKYQSPELSVTQILPAESRLFHISYIFIHIWIKISWPMKCLTHNLLIAFLR